MFEREVKIPIIFFMEERETYLVRDKELLDLLSKADTQEELGLTSCVYRHEIHDSKSEILFPSRQSTVKSFPRFSDDISQSVKNDLRDNGWHPKGCSRAEVEKEGFYLMSHYTAHMVGLRGGLSRRDLPELGWFSWLWRTSESRMLFIDSTNSKEFLKVYKKGKEAEEGDRDFVYEWEQTYSAEELKHSQFQLSGMTIEIPTEEGNTVTRFHIITKKFFNAIIVCLRELLALEFEQAIIEVKLYAYALESLKRKNRATLAPQPADRQHLRKSTVVPFDSLVPLVAKHRHKTRVKRLSKISKNF